jgi:hypothetical protein
VSVSGQGSRLDAAVAWLRARGLAWLLLLQSAVVAVVLTWPAVFRLERVLGGKDADTMKHIWTLWWCRAHLLREGLGLQTELLNQPAGLELWPVEPLNGAGAVLLAWLPVVATANLLAVANLLATGLCSGLLGWELTRSRSGALCTALLVQSSSFALFAIHVGVGELQHLWLLPLGCWSLLRLARGGQWRFALLTGLVLGGGTVACFYYGFYLALALLVLGLAALVPAQRRLRLLGQLITAAAVAALVVLPVTRAFAASYGEEFHSQYGFWSYLLREGLGQTVIDPVGARLQPEDLVFGRSHLWGQGFGDLEAYGGGKLLGLPMLLLAAVGVARQPRRGLAWLALAALGITLALGSYLSVGGEELLVGGARLRLPFLYLNRILAFAAEPLNFPVRFLAVTTIALACMAGLALRGAGRTWRWVAVALALLNVADLQLRGLLPWPLPSFELPRLEPLMALDQAGHPASGSGAVLDLSGAFRHDPESRLVVMSAQLQHQQPIQAVPIDRLEFHVREGRWFAAGLGLVSDLAPPYMKRGEAGSGEHLGDLHVLRQAGFDRLLVVSMGGREPLPEAFLDAAKRTLGDPVLQGEIYAVWTVPEIEATPEQATVWEREHAERAQRAREETLTPGPMPAMGPHRPEPPPGAAGAD